MDDSSGPTTPRSTALSLPERMYLLCYDLTRDRLGDDTTLVRGQLLRAAAVADLRLAGQLSDRDGRAVRGSGLPNDAFPAEVLDTVPVDAATLWFTVVDARWWAAEASVRDELAARQVITTRRRRWLGLIPYHDVTPTDPTGLRDLRERIRTVAFEGDPTRAPLSEVAIATIAVYGDADTVLTSQERREHRAAVRTLGRYVDTVLPGLRNALVWSVAARRSATSV